MYLRQIEPGKGRDPTMTYVSNLAAIQPGHWLRTTYGYLYVVSLREVAPLIVLAETLPRTQEALDDLRRYHPNSVPIVHDLRDEAIETWRYGAMLPNGEMPTREQARAMVERVFGPS